MPKMPGGDDGDKKEESAESREEAKEQVRLSKFIGGTVPLINFWGIYSPK